MDRYPAQAAGRPPYVGSVLFEWDNNGGWPILSVGTEVSGLLGISAGQLVGRNYRDLIHPRDKQRVAEEVATWLRGKAPLHQHEDYRLVRPDGGVLWVRDVSLVRRDGFGQVDRILGYVSPVTLEHEQLVELEQQRERLAVVLEGTRLGLWDWNPQTDAVTFDERWAEMLGYRLDEVEPSLTAWQSRVHPEDLEDCFQAIQAHMKGEVDFYENVHRMQHRDGRWLYILDRGRVCEWDEEGRPTRFSGTHTDITPQKMAEIEARVANQAKSTFLARMSHEIRTPLNGILGTLQLLGDTQLDPQQMEYLQLIASSGDTLLHLINDILDSSKIEAGELRVEPRPFRVRDLLTSVFGLYREKAEGKGLTYRLQVDPSLPDALHGDDHRVRQILANLLSNAVKFTAAGEVRLEVGTGPWGDGPVPGEKLVQLQLDVVDSGIGMADPDAVWQPFRQADGSIARDFGGTGLGLTICRQLTELMGGSVGCTSTPGAGSRFLVRLPMGVADARDVAPALAKGSEDELPCLKVLVADDNAVNRLVLRKMLERFGQEVTQVEDGAAAVAVCAARGFDLVLMDLHMPELDGYSACQQIRAALGAGGGGGRLPRIVAVSADVFAPEDERFGATGFDASMSKPFKASQVADLLRSTGPR